MVMQVQQAPSPQGPVRKWAARVAPVPVVAFVAAHPVLSVFVALTTTSIGIVALCAHDSWRRQRRPRAVPALPEERDEHEVEFQTAM